jgi:hypothetical protein
MRLVKLGGANLRGANLDGANLGHADLTNAEMDLVSLCHANLKEANLGGARVSQANLSNAILTGANLAHMQLSEVILSGADLTGAYLDRTQFIFCDDLHEAVGLDELVHNGPCSLDQHTLRASVARLPDWFLRGVGYTQDEVIAFHKLYGEEISYARKVDEIPRHLRSALAENQCVLFLGAGASMSAVDVQGEKLPHWGMMLSELLNRLQDQAPDPEIVAENQDLLDKGDLMSPSEWIDSKLGRYEFIHYLQQRLATASESPVHEILSAKPFRAVMTTNYDNLIEDYWHRNGRNPFVVIPQNTTAITTATQALQGNLQRTPVIKAHGSWDNPDSLVFGPKSYREIMFRNEPFRQFMSRIFGNYVVLFVGFSFRDPNFQSVLQWIYTTTEGQIPTHYAILDSRGPVFKHYMERNYNIRMISYPAPAGDHSALLRILQSL